VRWEEGSWDCDIGHPTEITNREMRFEHGFFGREIKKREDEKMRRFYLTKTH